MYGLRYKHIRIKDQQSNSKIDKIAIKIVNIPNLSTFRCSKNYLNKKNLSLKFFVMLIKFFF